MTILYSHGQQRDPGSYGQIHVEVSDADFYGGRRFIASEFCRLADAEGLRPGEAWRFPNRSSLVAHLLGEEPGSEGEVQAGIEAIRTIHFEDQDIQGGDASPSRTGLVCDGIISNRQGIARLTLLTDPCDPEQHVKALGFCRKLERQLSDLAPARLSQEQREDVFP